LYGAKLVLFITGLCDKSCWYCPLSFEKRGRDVVYANERPVRAIDDVIEEAEAQGAEGAGITGGNPLLVFDRVIEYLRGLKDYFGESFHIHLYTAVSRALTVEKVRTLEKIGLDELRIHLMLDNPQEWKIVEKIVGALSNMAVGVEIPVIPDLAEDIKKMIMFLDRVGVLFLNMNELEFSESNSFALKMRGYSLRKNSFSAVNGSHEAAMDIMEWAEINVKNLSIHYCPAFIKDSVQYKNRLIRTAKRVKKRHEVITDEGTLIKGVVIHSSLSLAELCKYIESIIGVSPYMDLSKNRVELHPELLEEISDKLKAIGCECYIVEELPTYGRRQVTQIAL